jgi:hypothetical protein
MSSGSLDFFAGVLRPGGGLVVERAGFEAAVQDADEPVGELAQRGPMTGPAGPQRLPRLGPARSRPRLRLSPHPASRRQPRPPRRAPDRRYPPVSVIHGRWRVQDRR